MGAFGVAREVPSFTGVDECLPLASEWLRNCSQNHDSCKPGQSFVAPARLLDLGTEINVERVFLRETRNMDMDNVRYMTLSHCWGISKFITTTTDTLSQRKEGIPISQLAKTFREAVAMTRGMGFQYLWIDSLCIIQDDLSDWVVESVKMADIYMGSQLNIAATRSSNAKGGLFREKGRWTLDSSNRIETDVGYWTQIQPVGPDDDGSEEEGEPYSIFVRQALHVAHDHFTRSMDYVNSIPEFAPLLNRAWVFQERMLAPRTLHFHNEEMIWECNSGISCECSRLDDYKFGDPDRPLEESTADQLKTMYTTILSEETTEKTMLDNWLEIISEYCGLRLTKETDRLPALAGLASRVAKRLESQYLAGLWSQDLPRQLCWVKDRLSRPSFRNLNSGSPSWSWASVWLEKGTLFSTPHITYNLVSSVGFKADSRFSVLEVNCSLRIPFGTCDEGWIKVQGAVISTTYVFEGQGMIRFKEGQESVSADELDENAQMRDIADEEPLYCLLIGASEKSRVGESSSLAVFALVLQKHSQREDAYKRVGLLDYRGGNQWWKDAPVVDVVIL
jgi:hypothetical protein